MTEFRLPNREYEIKKSYNLINKGEKQVTKCTASSVNFLGWYAVCIWLFSTE